MKSYKFTQFLQKNMFPIIIALVGTVYILTGLSRIIRTGDTVGEIIANSALTTILGWFISAMFGQQAIVDAFDHEDIINALNTLAKEIESIDPHIRKLDTFCEYENRQKMIRRRTRILGKAGITYEEFEKGLVKKQLTKRQWKTVKKAQKIGYGYLTSDWLLSDIEEAEIRDKKPENVQVYSFRKNVYNLITKTVTGILSGIYVLEPLLHGVNWNIVIWRLFFFGMWILFGYVRYGADFNYITKTYRKTIVMKTTAIVKFKCSLVEQPELYGTIPSPTKDEQPITQPKKDNLLTEEIIRKEAEPDAEVLRTDKAISTTAV